jgi:phosphonate transport system permease protein
MRMFEYGQVATLTLALLALVWLTDAASRALRRLLRANVPAGRLGHQRLGLALPRARRSGVAIAVAAMVVVSAAALFDRDTFDAGTPARMARFAAGFFPPDLAPTFLRSVVEPVAQTLGISLIGTLIGVAIGALLGIPAAAPYAEDDQARRAAWWVRRTVCTACRGGLSLLRAIPEVLWVLVFVIAVGLGPFAGTLALGVHTGGVLGKLYADTLEEVSPLPLRGLRATGATPLQILAWGAWPETRRMLVSYTVLRWEMNLRTSTVVGIAGGGGVGMALYNAVQLGAYAQVATLIAVIYGLVVATGWLGDAALRRFESASLSTRRR